MSFHWEEELEPEAELSEDERHGPGRRAAGSR